MLRTINPTTLRVHSVAFHIETSHPANICISLHSRSNAQLTFTCSKSTGETLSTYITSVSSVSIVCFERVNVSWAFDLLCSEVQHWAEIGQLSCPDLFR